MLLMAAKGNKMTGMFSREAISPLQEYAWALLQSAFADVLTADQWAALWDHLVCTGSPMTS
jgi:hypothetical protein